MGDYAIGAELTKAYERRNWLPLPLKEASASEFQAAIKKAKATHKYGMFVDKHTIPEYEGMTTILTKDGNAGVAIEEDGNIVSLFSCGENKHAIRTLLPVAIEKGGIKLDNYSSSRLSFMYAMYGFIPISRVLFDRRYAPPNWNYERDGELDIVFWLHNGCSAAEIVSNLGIYAADWNKAKLFDTYEKAGDYRDSIIHR